MITHFVAYHASHVINKDYRGMHAEKAPFNVAVDSGQAGVFDSANYQNDESIAHLTDADRLYAEDKIRWPEEPWYSWCCDRTLGEAGAGIVPNGAVSSTAYGDGSYECTLVKEDGLVVGVIIDFVGEEEEDDDYECDDSWIYDEEEEEV